MHPKDIKSQMRPTSGSGSCTIAAFCTMAGRHLGHGQISAPDYVARLQITHNSLNRGFLIGEMWGISLTYSMKTGSVG